MKIFISWSGDKSRHIAETLSNWIEQVLQATEPWISTEIDKGKRWSDEIASRLEESSIAIICLTEENLDSKWIHFEAGAIAKNKNAYVCTFLYDLKPTSVEQPLSQFQNTKFVKKDVLKLCTTINEMLQDEGFKSIKESNLKSVFDTFWPKLEKDLKEIPKAESEIRSNRDIMEESLQILRTLRAEMPSLKRPAIEPRSTAEQIYAYIASYVSEKKLTFNDLYKDDHSNDIVNFIIEYDPSIVAEFPLENDLRDAIIRSIKLIKSNIGYIYSK